MALKAGDRLGAYESKSESAPAVWVRSIVRSTLNLTARLP